MSPRRVIVDAGPSLNFCATSSERLLLDVLHEVGAVLAPDIVSDEVRRKSIDTRRFGPAAKKWTGLVEHRHIELLASNGDDEGLAAAIDRLTGAPIDQRLKRPKDLGEVLVVAHAMVLREAGYEPVVLIDDGYGQSLAGKQHLRVLTTERVLVRGAQRGLVADRGEMRKVYQQMRRCDDGLVSIEQTRLLDHHNWRSH